jgi:hyperosmotically inducible periplasmic protein
MFKSNTSKPTYKTIAMTALATLFFCGATLQPAFAETKMKDVVAEAPADADFKKLDMNGDKKLSLKEAVKDKSLATSFDVTDMNKDGSITADEYSSYKAAMQMKAPDSAVTAPSSSAPSSTPAPTPVN